MKSGTCLFTGKASESKADAAGSRKKALGPSQNVTTVLVLGELQQPPWHGHHPKSAPLRQAHVAAPSAT